MSDKIKVKNPIVEMDGDEMTRIIWHFIKDKLIYPFVDIDLKYYDLGIKQQGRDRRQGHCRCGKRYKGIRRGSEVCYHNPQCRPGKRIQSQTAVEEPQRHDPFDTGRHSFRKPIIIKNIPPAVSKWKKPIIIGRHAYGDIYKNVEYVVDGPGTAELVFTPLTEEKEGRQDP